MLNNNHKKIFTFKKYISLIFIYLKIINKTYKYITKICNKTIRMQKMYDNLIKTFDILYKPVKNTQFYFEILYKELKNIQTFGLGSFAILYKQLKNIHNTF